MSRLKKDIKQFKRTQIIIVVIFVILLLIILLCLLKIEFSWGFIDRKELLDITSDILGGYLGFIIAYFTLTYQMKQDKENKIYEMNNEIEYKKLMLFTLLDYTIYHTNDIYKQLDKCYNDSIIEAISENIDIIDILSKDYEVNHLENDKLEKYEIKSELDNDSIGIMLCLRYKQINFLKNSMDLYFKDGILRHNNMKKLVYDKNWTDYIDCLEKMDNNATRNMQRIINWITLLENNAENYDVMDFVLRRRGIRMLIDELYPKARETGFRNSSIYL